MIRASGSLDGVVPPGAEDRVRRHVVAEGGVVSRTTVLSAARSEGLVLTDDAVAVLVETLHRDLGGLGALEPLLDDPEVTDILVNAPDSVWVDRGTGLVRTDIGFGSDLAVRRLAQRLALSVGRELDDAHPWVDAGLPLGIRMHAVLPPLTEHPVLSLRVARRRPFSFAELVAEGTVHSRLAGLLAGLVTARRSFLVTGGTGTGKTTLLGALLGLVPDSERLVVVEETTELNPEHPHVVRLTGRPPNGEGVGAVDLSTLVRQALRMRPDRLVVGEVRGAEVVDLLTALNTGHEGGCGTVHANRAEDLPARVEALAALAGMGQQAAQSLLVAAVDVVVHLDRSRDGTRRVAEVAVVARDQSRAPVVRTAWRVAGAECEAGPAAPELLAQATPS